uniref:TIL domain-containing protein n=1 Tax=Caenorhabditis tropicalis TaxID=1561998 RepID=A0A1I7UQ67_9PELO
MGCGAEGWCAFRCCPTERQQHMARTNKASRRIYPNPNFGNNRNQQVTGSSRAMTMSRYPYVNRNPAVRTTTPAPLLKQCANACMPQCSSRCLQRYNQIVASFMNSLTAIDVMGQPVEEPRKNVRFSPKKTVECRDECMPYCTPQCLEAYSAAEQNLKPKVCKAVCMPDCTEECVTAPPLMVPCIFDNVCHCPAGYVRCSEMTCCMKYKTMAVRYRNRMTSMSFSDDDENEPKVSAIVYYPEQGKAEILKNDGSVVVEVMESAQEAEMEDV